MQFGGLQKTSLIDFPDRVSTVLFTSGCNLRCPFCHNWRLVVKKDVPSIPEKSILDFLVSRKKFIKSVVVTGGEPAVQPDLFNFLKQLKEKEFNVKLDTNGFFPKVIQKCVNYLDYIAVDVKTSLEKYALLGDNDTSDLLKTIEIVKAGNVDYEFRTTVVPGFIDKVTISKIGRIVNGSRRYALQQFLPDDALDEAFRKVKPYSSNTIVSFANILKKHVKEIIIRV